jgi:tRNA(Ile)-lysidine synthase
MLLEFERKIADFAKANELFSSGGKILLAVSGGADSTALLYVMQRLVDEGILNTELLLCAHINHQLRGCEADLDEQFVIGQAGELNLPIITRRVDVQGFALRNKLSIETSARKLRLESLLEIAKANDCFFVATAHQKNDNAETILHRLLRGTGFRGLAGIWPVRVFTGGFTLLDNSANMDTTQNTTISNGVKFVRPLLGVRRDEITRYLQELNLKWREDHTNADCTYTRNYIRHRLLPALQQDYTGSIVEDLSRLAQQGRKLNYLVRERTEKVWPELANSGENSVALNLKTFILEPKLVRVELIRRSITALGSGERDLTQRHYERILQLADEGANNRRNELPGGFVVWRESGNLIFARPRRISVGEKQIIESVKLNVPGQTRFSRYLIEAESLGAAKEDLKEFKAVKNNFVERFDLDRLKLPLVIRFRRRGDRFRPLGLAAEKKVGKFLTDAKVPHAPTLCFAKRSSGVQKMRGKTLIIADSEKIIWVWPIRISEQAKMTGQTRRVLQLRITETEPL